MRPLVFYLSDVMVYILAPLSVTKWFFSGSFSNIFNIHAVNLYVSSESFENVLMRKKRSRCTDKNKYVKINKRSICSRRSAGRVLGMCSGSIWGSVQNPCYLKPCDCDWTVCKLLLLLKLETSLFFKSSLIHHRIQSHHCVLPSF